MSETSRSGAEGAGVAVVQGGMSGHQGGPLGGDFRPWSLSSAVEQRLAAAPCRWLPNNFGVDSKL